MSNPLEFAVQTARQTGEILLEHFSLGGTLANLKADHTAVTEADLAADRYITQAIQKNFPEDAILSEESNQYVKDASQPIWIIDPLDGTSNFSMGLPVWGVSIARLRKGIPETAAVYFPWLDELYSSQKGQGAFLNEENIHTKTPQEGQPTAFFSCCTRTNSNYHIRVPYKIRILGSAAYDMCSVARGSSAVAFQASPKIWDIAAGWLLIIEAGGTLNTSFGDSPFPIQPNHDYSKHSFPVLMAATAKLSKISASQIILKN